MAAIELQIALRDDFQCIENLMQFYTYDFSEWLPLEFARHGFFNIAPKLDYFRKSTTSAFIIKVGKEIAGFVTVDDDVNFDDVAFNIGHFFVSRRYRGQGVASTAVSLLLKRFIGRWQIYYIDANQPARLFWSKLIPGLTHNAFTQHQLQVDGYDCTLYRFDNSSAQ